MMIIDLFRLSFKNLKKKKFRTIANIFSVAMGATIIITLVSLGVGLQSFFQKKTEDIYGLKQIKILPVLKQSDAELNQKINTVNTEGKLELDTVFKEHLITNDFISSLSTDNRVDELLLKYSEFISEVDVDGKKLKDPTITHFNSNKYLSIEKESLQKINDKERIQIPLNYISFGKDISDADTKSVLINEELAIITFGSENISDIVGKEITLTSDVSEHNLNKKHSIKATIVGVIDQRFFQPSIVVSKDIMESFKNFYTNTEKSLYDRPIDMIELSAKNMEDVPSMISEIETNNKYTTESVQLVASTINKGFIWLKFILGLIGGIVILISSLGVINTMVSAVNERTKSIGLMKATGASNLTILKLFIIEGSLIGFIGSLFGLIISTVNISQIKIFIENMATPLNIESLNGVSSVICLDPSTVYATILIATILTITASIYPAFKAFRLNPIDALKK